MAVSATVGEVMFAGRQMTAVIVETAYGKLQGLSVAGLSVFRAVPFAQPPTGDLRFRAPVPPHSWSGVRDATRFGPGAPQRDDDVFVQTMIDTYHVYDEDCLTLNVWTPGVDGERRPVLVWIPGGSFLRGAASWPIYDPAVLARRGNVVVVTVQYRLGALGFLHLHEAGADPQEWPSNLGLRDQIAALGWVRDEISAFGGDPSDVTIFGQSAGAVAIGVLLGVPSARGLFRRAILQSGAPMAIPPVAAAPVAETFLRSLQVDQHQLSRLREVPVEAILATTAACEASPGSRSMNLPFLPVIDGDLIPRDPLDVIRDGLADDVAVLVGCTSDEMTPFLLLEPDLIMLDESALRGRCEALLANLYGSAHPTGDTAKRIVDRYRQQRAARGELTEPWAVWSAIKADAIVRHPLTRLAELQRAHGTAAYVYAFTWTSPFMGGLLGACHMLDLPFLFGHLDNPRTDAFTGTGPDAERLATRMQDAWIAFARTSNPSHADLGDWPKYDVPRRATMMLGRECGVQDAPHEAERQMWD